MEEEEEEDVAGEVEAGSAYGNGPWDPSRERETFSHIVFVGGLR